MTRQPMNLGRNINHDPRSWSFPAPRAPKVKDVLWTRHGDTLDQGDTSSCTGHAMAHAANHDPINQAGHALLTHDDALAIYSDGTRYDPFPGVYPPTDTGSSGLAVAKAAKKRGLITSYRWCFGLNHVLEALTLAPVLLGTQWTEGMFTPDKDGVVTPTGPDAGGHEYLAVGIDTRAKTITCQNSWGNRWGQDGRFKMTWDTLDLLLHASGDATVVTRKA